MSEHFLRALDEARLVIANPMLFAERLHQGVHFLQVVTRTEREEVVFNLVLKPAAEPVHERRTRHVTRGGHLQ